MDPAQLFVRDKDKYSAFSEDGIPTHDKEGKELSGKSKKVRGVEGRMRNDLEPEVLGHWLSFILRIVCTI